MAVVSGTVHSVHTIMSAAVSELQVAEVLFTLDGTYAQVDNGTLTGLAAAIQSSRRNGKTVTPRAVMMGTPATKESDNSLMTLKTLALAAGAATFEVAGDDYDTELANGAVPAQARPFALLVAFTEA